MKANVLLALVAAVSIRVVSFIEESIMIPRSLAEITNGRGVGAPLSSGIRRWVDRDHPINRFWLFNAFWSMLLLTVSVFVALSTLANSR